METIAYELIARILRKAGYTARAVSNTGTIELPYDNLTITIEGQKILIRPTYGLPPITAEGLSIVATRTLELADPSFKSKLLAIILSMHQQGYRVETITTQKLIARILIKAGHITTILSAGAVELPYKNLTITVEGQKILIGPTYGLSPIAKFDGLPSMAAVRTMIEEIDRKTSRTLELADPSFKSKLLAIIELGLGFDIPAIEME